MTTSSAPRQVGFVRRVLLMFRHWRRTRPFYAGLLTMLAAIPLLYFPLAPIAVFFRLGMGAIAGGTIAILLAICGLSMWFAPSQRVVVGLISVVLSLAAFPLSNLGGFVVGTLLGLLGGSMAVSWGKTKKQRLREEAMAERAAAAEASSDTADLSGGTTGVVPAT